MLSSQTEIYNKYIVQFYCNSTHNYWKNIIFNSSLSLTACGIPCQGNPPPLNPFCIVIKSGLSSEPSGTHLSDLSPTRLPLFPFSLKPHTAHPRNPPTHTCTDTLAIRYIIQAFAHFITDLTTDFCTSRHTVARAIASYMNCVVKTTLCLDTAPHLWYHNRP